MVIKVKYNGEWVKIPYMSSDIGKEYIEEAPKDNKQYARQDGTWTVVNIPDVDLTAVYEEIDTKVDKVTGKGLSTNDYINTDKTKVTNVNEVVETASRSVSATNISITLGKRNLVTNTVGNIELNLPASTTSLAGLMLPADKTKLNGIAAGAEVNVNADWNATSGDAKILNKPVLSTVATSGNYSDLNGKPTLATVATSGSYRDLKNTPTLATVATSGSYDDLSGKPSLAKVATSGSYNDLAGKPVLATVATSGSYNDLKDVPDPTLIEAADGNYPEDNLQGILLNMIFGGKTSITQNEYDVISSAIPVGKIACKYSYNCGLSLDYGIGEFLLLRGEDEGEIYVYAYNIQKQVGISSNIIGHALIKSDLSVVLGMEHTIIQSENTSLTIRSGNEKTEVAISLHIGGDGTKALMDNGEYKEIGGSGGDSGVDITNYIADGLEFKSATTKEGFEKIRESILQNKHMYTFWNNIDPSNIANSVAFRIDVITQALYGAVILVLLDAGNSKLVQLTIDPSNYTISKTQI